MVGEDVGICGLDCEEGRAWVECPVAGQGEDYGGKGVRYSLIWFGREGEGRGTYGICWRWRWVGYPGD